MEDELRITFVVCTKTMPTSVTRMAEHVLYLQGVLKAFLDGSELLAAYESQNTPKLVKRTKKASELAAIEQDCVSAGLPAFSEGGVLIVGPATRSQLPEKLDRLQLLTVSAQDALDDIPPVDDVSAVQFVVRTDLNMSMGKLVAQIGHAAWPWSDVEADARANIHLVSSETALLDACRHWRLLPIVDAGRTELSGPTATVAALTRMSWTAFENETSECRQVRENIIDVISSSMR